MNEMIWNKSIAQDTWFVIASFLSHRSYLTLRLAIPSFANDEKDPIRQMVKRSHEREDQVFSIVGLAYYHDLPGLRYFVSKGWEIDQILYEHCYQLKKRIVRIERYIFVDAEMFYLYTSRVSRCRIKEAEFILSQSPHYTYKYMHDVLTEDELDDFIRERKHRVVRESPKYLYKTLLKVRKNMFPYQSVIRYMRYHLKVKYMYLLCINVLNARCPELEGLIITHPWYSYFYIRHLVGTRLPEAEKYMLISQSVTQMYVENVVLAQPGPLKRWKEAENHIRHNVNLGFKYYRRLLTQWTKDRIRLIRRRNG